MHHTLFQSMRPPFLILTPICVFLGIASASNSVEHLSLTNVWLIFIGALSAHVSVNTFNEYFDFKSGLDAQTNKTPFSGGSGALLTDPAASGAVLKLAIVTLLLTSVIGLYFTIKIGAILLPIGILGIVVVVTYTPYVNRSALLCLIAPGLGFGPLMVLGTQLILAGTFSPQSFYVALMPFFLVNNLLLLNQLPDIDADKMHGRRHFPIVFGIKNSLGVYGLFAFAAAMVIVIGLVTQHLPLLTAISLLPLLMALPVAIGASRYAQNTKKLVPYLAANVVMTLTSPLLLAITMLR